MNIPWTIELQLVALKMTNIIIDLIESDERSKLEPELELRLIDLLAYTKNLKESIENVKPINNN